MGRRPGGDAVQRDGEPRILFLLHRYPPVFGGGALFVKQIRDSIHRLGLQSLVVTGDRGISAPEDPDIYRLPTVRGMTSTRLSLYLYALMVGPVLVALRHRYDLIHTMGNGHYVYVGILMGRLLRKPVIVASVQNRGDDPGGIVTERFGGIKSAIFARASSYVCCSGLQLRVYRAAGYPVGKVRFIPNAFDPARFRPCRDVSERSALRERLGLPRDEFVVASIGAIVERKGIDLLAEGWIRFRQSGHRGTLVLVGPSRVEDPGGDVDQTFIGSVRARFSRSEVSDSVLFTGRVGNPEDYLRAADAFALMSRGEGFPLALIEAMACGLPFLVWNLPDYEGYDLGDGVQGFLIPPFETALLAERLKTLAAPDGTREIMGRQAQALASRFTLDRSVSEYLALYRALVPPRAAIPALPGTSRPSC